MPSAFKIWANHIQTPNTHTKRKVIPGLIATDKEHRIAISIQWHVTSTVRWPRCPHPFLRDNTHLWTVTFNMLSTLPDFLSFFRIQFLYIFLWGKLEKNVTASDRISLRWTLTDWKQITMYTDICKWLCLAACGICQNQWWLPQYYERRMDESASWDTWGLTQSPCKQVPVLKVCRGAFTRLKRPVLVVGTRFHFSIHQARAIPKGFSNANFRNQQCQKKQGQKSQLLCENTSSLNIQFLAKENLTFSFPVFRRH